METSDDNRSFCSTIADNFRRNSSTYNISNNAEIVSIWPNESTEVDFYRHKLKRRHLSQRTLRAASSDERCAKLLDNSFVDDVTLRRRTSMQVPNSQRLLMSETFEKVYAAMDAADGEKCVD